MSQWAPLRIGDIGELFDGPHATPKSKGKVSTDYIFLSISSLENGRLNLKESPSISEEDYLSWTRRVTPQAQDLVFSYETRLGEGALIPAGLTCCLGRRMALLRPNQKVIEPRFLLYLFLGPKFQQTIAERTIHGSTVNRIALNDFPDFPILLPDITEQRRIAGVLGALDDKIESNQAVITRAEQLIDEIAVQRATDLPMVALSEVCSLSKSTWKPETSPDQTVQLFSLPAFDEGATPEQAAVASIKSNKTLMDRPGILVSRLNPRISRMWWVETDAARVNVCSPEFAYLTAGDMHGLACTWLAVRSPEFRGEMVDRVTGTSGSHQRVRPADLMTIGVPDYRSLAEHIQATVLTLLHLVSDRRRQSVALAELRDVLLPELMSGRMRVDEAGCLVSEALDEEVRSV
jgi:restriction modification system DNA specificity domain protein